MKPFAIILLIALALLSGCDLLESKDPFIQEITNSPEKISQGEEFKMFVTIKNPTSIEFKPYIILNYDQNEFQYQSYYTQNKIIPLEIIPSKQEKSYLLKFSVKGDAESGVNPIGVYLLGEETAKQSLSYKEKNIDIASGVN